MKSLKLKNNSHLIEFMLNVKVKDKKKIYKAVENIKKLKRECPNFDTVKEIRKWRKR